MERRSTTSSRMEASLENMPFCFLRRELLQVFHLKSTSLTENSVRSSTYCDLFVLTQEDFQQVLQDFPEFAETMRKEGIKRVVEKMDFFKGFNKEFTDTLVGLLKPQAFSAGK